MRLDNADFWRLVSCVSTVLTLAEGAGRLAEAPAVVEELCGLVDMDEDQCEAVDRLVKVALQRVE